ncbi:hypothetical protein N9H39_02190 [Gammaproteobacteria bacterium]|nr:hypothetical protein [Gammaproteobacteria bacterium]
MYSNLSRAGEDDAYINVRVWDTEHNPLYFPERDDPALKLSRMNGSGPTFGIAFSGGGTRSAAAMLGQLKTLKALGWIEQAHYMSAVSGGSWALVPFVFLQDEYCRQVSPLGCDDAFLGDYVPPEAIDDFSLRAKSKFGLARDLYQSSLVLRYFKRLLIRGDETFSSAIGRNFLDRFGLNEQRWFTHREAIDEVVKSSGRLRDEFYTTAPGRPFLIVSATLLARRKSTAWYDKFLLEITPLYAGIRARHDAVLDDLGHPRVIGGGYVEVFGYDSVPLCAIKAEACTVLEHGGLVRVKVGMKRYRFTLRDVVGVSGAAPAEVTASHGYDTFGLPEFKYWPVNTENKVTDYIEFRHGDGGHIDNTGLLPLLIRQVDNILVFKNSKRAFCTEAMKIEGVERCSAGQPTHEIHDDQLKRFFLERTDQDALTDQFAIFDYDLLEQMQHEFRDRKLACEQDYRSPSCKPLVFCAKHTVSDNRRYGVSATKNGKPYMPNICWVYLDRDGAWIGTIRDQSKLHGSADGSVVDLLRGNGAFIRFPHYRTFLENTKPIPRSIRLKRVQVNAIRYLTAWTLQQSAAEISAALEIQ